MVWHFLISTLLFGGAFAQFFMPPFPPGPLPPPIPPQFMQTPPFQQPSIANSGAMPGFLQSGSNLIGPSGGGGHNSQHPLPQTASGSSPARSSVPARSAVPQRSSVPARSSVPLRNPAPARSSVPSRSSAPAQTISVPQETFSSQPSGDTSPQRPQCLDQDFLQRCLQGTNQGMQACIDECFANTQYNAEDKLKCEVNCYDLYYRRLSSCITLEK